MPSYLEVIGGLIDLQAASMAAALATASRCLMAARDAQPVAGCGRVGVLTLLADLDHARGRRRQA